MSKWKVLIQAEYGHIMVSAIRLGTVPAGGPEIRQTVFRDVYPESPGRTTLTGASLRTRIIGWLNNNALANTFEEMLDEARGTYEIEGDPE